MAEPTLEEREQGFLEGVAALEKQFGIYLIADFERIEKFEGAKTKLEVGITLRTKPLPGWKPPEAVPTAPPDQPATAIAAAPTSTKDTATLGKRG